MTNHSAKFFWLFSFGKLHNGCVSAFRLYSLLAVTLLTCDTALADLADRIMNYSESKLLSMGTEMAEAVAANAPVRVDSATVMVGAIFVRQTKTFIYKYDIGQTLDLGSVKSYAVRSACGDPVRKAFMLSWTCFSSFLCNASRAAELRCSVW